MSKIIVNGRTWTESELRELAGDLKAAVPPMAVNGGIAIGDLLDYIAANPAPAALRAAFEQGAEWWDSGAEILAPGEAATRYPDAAQWQSVGEVKRPMPTREQVFSVLVGNVSAEKQQIDAAANAIMELLGGVRNISEVQDVGN